MRKLMVVALGAVLYASVASAQTRIVNNDGGVCIDAEGGLRPGARLIAFSCHGGDNQNAKIVGGRLKIGNLCATADSRNQGAEIRLQNCVSGEGSDLGQRQNFAWWTGGHIGHNTGYVLAASGRHWGTNRPLCLWSKESRSDQKWRTGTFMQISASTRFNEATKVVYVPGQQGSYRVSGGQLIGADGGTLVAAGAGNIVAAGAGN